MDANCPHKPAQSQAATAAPAGDDDHEQEAEGETLHIEELEESELLNCGDVTKKQKTDPKDVFCFAKPLDYYNKIFTITILNLSSG